jgi:hypothetical protein
VAGELLEYVPRTAVEGTGVVWGDGAGLNAEAVADRIATRLRVRWEVGCGVAESAIGAYAASIDRTDPERVRVVERGNDRSFLRDRPISVLKVEPRLRQLLEGVGIETCGELSEIDREAVEVRFGAEAVGLWRLSRGEDGRRLFRSALTDRPQASLDFIDYVVTDPDRLTFTANALLGGMCETLAAGGAHARRMELTLVLANGESFRKTLRPARPTASRVVWLRQVKRVLERLTVPDAVSGLSLAVLDTEAASAVQGDLFDAGFATSAVVESALTRLLESQGPVMVRAESNTHPLAEHRSEFVALDAEMVSVWSGTRVETAAGRVPGVTVGSGETLGLTLQLIQPPRPIAVEGTRRSDHTLPARYRDGEWRQLLTVAGPDRITGGEWSEPYSREYFRCVTADGLLIWIYHDLLEDRWFLHGHWD